MTDSLGYRLQHLSKVKCTLGSKVESLGTVSSPALKNPKNARQHAAHNNIWSGLVGSLFHTSFSRLRIGGEMGRCFADSLVFHPELS